MFTFTKSSYKETNIQPEISIWSDLSLANVNVDLCLIILSIYSIPYTCNSSIYEHVQVYRIQTFFARKKNRKQNRRENVYEDPLCMPCSFVVKFCSLLK